MAPLKASQIRPRIVSATRTSIVVRIPKAVGRGTSASPAASSTFAPAS